MTDVHSKAVRSKNMAAIKSRNTGPEMIIRKLLHSLGFRFRLHNKKLPGTPDITLPKYKTLIFINGCFWHKHDCELFKLPKSRSLFWSEKLRTNKQRDVLNINKLLSLGWKIIIIWECSLKGRSKLPLEYIGERLVYEINHPNTLDRIVSIDTVIKGGTNNSTKRFL